MPNTAWRCSQCGTVNEPVATSCRSCGRWPSLFDLQESAIGDAEEPVSPRAARPGRLEAPRPVYVPDDEELASNEPEPAAPETSHREDEPGPPMRSPARMLLRFAIPIGLVLYFLISSYFSNH